MPPQLGDAHVHPVIAGPSKAKVRRNPRACDACNRRSVRCRPALDNPSSCQHCTDYGERCVFNRPVRRRGRPRESVSSTLQTPLPQRTQPSETELKSFGWVPKLAITQRMVTDLTEIFFEVVYPVFPLFHRASLLRSVSRAEHLEDQALYASVIAMCALSSARARDGALVRQSWDPAELESPTSEELFEAAVHAIPSDILANQSLGFMRASLLLAITAIQYGSPTTMSYHLSRYHTYVAVGALHDETNWPGGISTVEIEERRRLFWSAYTLDVFTSVVWGRAITSREASSNVHYPMEIDDESIETRQIACEADMVSWLRGWNYVTDMYRILEYAVSDLQRSRAPTLRTPAVPALQELSTPSQSAVLDRITAMYAELPDIFKTTAPPTLNFRQDLYSFQAANITATVQLVRMIYFSSDDSRLEQKCHIASEVLAAFASMPITYLRAISSPLLYHLAEIGKTLGAAFKSGMSASLYHSVRSVLIDLTAFLAEMEKKLCCPTDASKKLEAQVMRIDSFILEQRQLSGQAQAVSSEVDVARNSVASDSSILTSSVTALEQQSPDFFVPPELLEDWDWAFSFN
ncbi:putative transcriptional regulatory protein [Pseudocercospora fuligena]|uniref:Putative transcriptional regulatory protein n=1 Tax=Pseudocercospora fuligena TaxID=685502 RepID=A0A8H6R6K0_9PEZI|nr:putative transcriptional regulatory protein [Pseudocercospora fuligena]